jgi:tetratricopeptide (TPR) repeat protein
MRINRVLWILVVFVFASALHAQITPSQTGGAAQQVQPSPRVPGTDATTELQKQQLEKQAKVVPTGPHPFTEKEIIKEIKNSPAETVIKDVNTLGVAFDMTPEIEKRLRKAKATNEMVEVIRRAGPRARETMAKLNMGPGADTQAIPKEEAEAFDQIKGALDPNKTIALVDDFVKKYPSSIVLSYVYSLGANAYQQKSDVEKVAEYADKSLKLKPDNLLSLILSAEMLPLPQYINKHPSERDKILQQAQSQANHALELIPKIPKRANEADADYQKRLAGMASDVHGALGMVHLELAGETLAGPDKAELAKAEQEFTTAVSTTAHPDPSDYYRMGEAYGLEGKLDDAIQAFTKASEFGQGTLIKTYADEQVAQLKQKKAQGPAASNPK